MLTFPNLRIAFVSSSSPSSSPRRSFSTITKQYCQPCPRVEQRDQHDAGAAGRAALQDGAGRPCGGSGGGRVLPRPRPGHRRRLPARARRGGGAGGHGLHADAADLHGAARGHAAPRGWVDSWIDIRA